jgi:exodeoxyribonuclease VII small subunit
MTAKKQQTEPFEAQLQALEEIVDSLEGGELDLEAALARYEDGVKRLKLCYEQLQRAEQRVKKLVGDREEPFEEAE